MNLYNKEEENHVKYLNTPINHNILDVRIEDWYDTSDWVGCIGCTVISHVNNKCKQCDRIRSKSIDPNFKAIRFKINRCLFPKIKLILDNNFDKYWFHKITDNKFVIKYEKQYPIDISFGI